LNPGPNKTFNTPTTFLGRAEGIEFFDHAFRNRSLGASPVPSPPAAVYFFKNVPIAKMAKSLDIGVSLAIANQHSTELFECLFSILGNHSVNVAANVNVRELTPDPLRTLGNFSQRIRYLFGWQPGQQYSISNLTSELEHLRVHCGKVDW
jgi:hypothetical protein